MRLKDNFDMIFNQVLSEIEETDRINISDDVGAAICVLADTAMQNLMELLSDNEPWEIRQFFEALNIIVEGGCAGIALYIVCMLLKLGDDVRTDAVISGFVLGTSYEEQFMEALVQEGYKYCIYQLIS